MKLILLLLVILMFWPTFAGQQPQSTLSDEEFEALLIKLLTPMQNGILPESEEGTEVTYRFTQDGVISEPDKVSKLKHIKGYITPPETRWYRQPLAIKDGFAGLGHGKSIPSELIISGRKVKSVRYEWTSDIQYMPPRPPYIRIQHTLGTENPVLLRDESGTNSDNWWAVTGIVEKQIGERKYLCAEIKDRMIFSGGYSITTRYVSPEIPGNNIEYITEYHLDDPKANGGLESFVTAQRIISIKPPTKN